MILYVAGVLPHPLRVGVEGANFLQVEQGGEGVDVAAALDAAAENGDGRAVRARQVAGGEGGRRAGAHRRDPGGVHDGERNPGQGIVEHQQAGDVGQAARLVAGVAGDPLHAGRLEAGDVGRHGVDEGVGPGVDAGLRRHLDVALPLLPEHLLESGDDVGHRQVDGLDVLPRQVQQGWFRHSILTGSASR